MIQQVVLSFEPGAVDRVGAARAHVRHRINMGNGKFGHLVKIGRQSPDPELIARERAVVATCGQIFWIVDGRT